ncbi:MAG: zinc-binding dehydrogenase [Alphaproteobacteria bacterium]|nr:zinc-binding dehydrogenase [Alphaproteobacteria bacterium]
MTNLPETMRAVVPAEEGGKRIPKIVKLPVPKPGPKEVLIKVAAAGLNRADLLQVQGMYPPPPGAPETLGMEASGTIVALGPETSRWSTGDQICVLVPGGGYAEYCVVHEGSVLPVPQGVSLVDAAALPEAYFTVWTNVVDRARLAPGETFLVHGGSSGIGTAAIQLFAARGHRVFATAGSPEKCEACKKLGAARAINYKTEDFVEVVKGETKNAGVDVILDMVGGSYVARNLQALKLEGRLVNIAFQEGAEVTLNMLVVMLKRLTLTGSTLRPRTPEQKAEIGKSLAREVWPLIDQGRIKPVVDSVFPLEKVAEAHARMAGSQHIGKILLSLG